MQNMSSYDWVLFTSLNAITYFFKRLEAIGQDSRILASCCIGAVGRATADELFKHGIRADLIPEKFTGAGLAESLIAGDMVEKHILLPRAEKAMETLPEMLEDAGATVTVAPVYRNVPCKDERTNCEKNWLMEI